MFRNIRSKSVPHGGPSSHYDYHRVYPEAPATKDDSGVFIVGPKQSLDSSSNNTDDEDVSDRASDSGSGEGEDQHEDQHEDEHEDEDEHEEDEEDEDDIVNTAPRAHSSATCSSVDYGPWTEEQLREWKSFCSKWGLD